MTLIAMVVPSSWNGSDPVNLTKFVLILPINLPLFEHLSYSVELMCRILWGVLPLKYPDLTRYFHVTCYQLI